MANKDIILSEASRELMPKTLQNSLYYAGNDQFVQAEYELKKEIASYCNEFEPWQVEFARRYSSGEPIEHIAESLKLYPKKLREFTREDGGKTLINYFVHLRILQDGLPIRVRQAMLERIAIDNEKENPKESIRAIEALNRMQQAQKAGGGFTVIINGVDLKKGALDG